MKKIKIKTNYGVIFDWFLNSYLNLVLWLNNVQDNENMAVDICAREINKMKGFFKI